MPRPAPFTVTPAAARHVLVDFDEVGVPGNALRVEVYYTSGLVTRQYKLDTVEPGEERPDDVRSEVEGLVVLVPRESYMRLWGHVLDLDVRPDLPRGAGLIFRGPDAGDNGQRGFSGGTDTNG